LFEVPAQWLKLEIGHLPASFTVPRSLTVEPAENDNVAASKADKKLIECAQRHGSSRIQSRPFRADFIDLQAKSRARLIVNAIAGSIHPEFKGSSLA
jgi:hypothetical protein